MFPTTVDYSQSIIRALTRPQLLSAVSEPLLAFLTYFNHLYYLGVLPRVFNLYHPFLRVNTVGTPPPSTGTRFGTLPFILRPLPFIFAYFYRF